MNARRALFIVIISAAALAQGCRNTIQPATPPPTPAPPTADRLANRKPTGEQIRPDVVTRPSDPGEVHGTAEVLAERAKTYAKSMGSMLYKHPVAPETSPAQSADAHEVAPLDPDAQLLAQDAASVASANKGSAVASADDRGEAGLTPALASARDAASTVGGTGGDDGLTRRLSQQLKDYPQDLAAQLDYQLLQLVKGEAVPQLPAMTGLSGEDREVVSALLDGISNFRSVVRADSNLLLSRKIKPMLELADRLRNQAELTIPTIVLCKRVDGFGVYEPMESERFAAGREQPAIVYCEVENFASQLGDKKMWETRLKQEIVLYTEQNGLEVWRDKSVKPIVDFSRNRRHDFFVVKMIRLPASLTIGRYLLKVSMEDQQVSRIAENTVAIQIVAQ